MRLNRRLVLAGLGLLIATSLPMLAHHSFAAEYDANKPIKISGVVTKMEWMNPHAHFYVDIKDENGKVTNWNFELGAIPVLLKQGWRKDSLKVGEMVTVTGNRAKNPESMNVGQATILSEKGVKVFSGNNGNAAQP